MNALKRVQQRISDACTDCTSPRRAMDINLIAVSKTFGVDDILPVLKEGHLDFGENKVQEAEEKWPDLKNRFQNVRLHLIGPLQTNKLRKACDIFDVIHTLDRPKLARKLADFSQEKGQCPDIFIQVNIGNEPQKAGILAEDLDDFVKVCRQSYNLGVTGLMAIPPQAEAPEPYFKQLAVLAKRNGLHNLSMGMSADFECAIQHEATHIRVGSAIFGARNRS